MGPGSAESTMKSKAILMTNIILCSIMLASCGRIIPNTGEEIAPAENVQNEIVQEENATITPTNTIEPTVAARSTDTPEGLACLTPTASVKISSVYLREGPDVRYKSTARYENGDKFTLLGHQRDWFKAEAADGNQGWLYKDWLTLPPDLDMDAVCSVTVGNLPPIPGTLMMTPSDNEDDCEPNYYTSCD